MNYTSATDFTGRTRWVYQELRDRKVALFIDHLPEGIWQFELALPHCAAAEPQASLGSNMDFAAYCLPLTAYLKMSLASGSNRR